MSNPKIITRLADICPHCSAINSIRITHGHKGRPGWRIAYGACKECGGRVVIREVAEPHNNLAII